MCTRKHIRWSGLAALPVLAGVASSQTSYEIIDLTERAASLGVLQAEARGINEAGQVVGFEVVSSFVERSILWGADGVRLLPSLPGDNSNMAVAIGSNGTVLGTSETVTLVPCGQLLKIFEDQKGVLWKGASVTRVSELLSPNQEQSVRPDLPFELRWTWDQSDVGEIVGWGRAKLGPPFTAVGYLLSGSKLTNLGVLDHPIAINNQGQIAGYASAGQDKAYLWEAGVLTNLHGHPSITGVTSRAWGIDDSDRVVGEAQWHISKPEEPTLWVGGVPQRLVPEFNRPQGVARAINGVGQVVGWYNDLDNLSSNFEGFIWENGVRTELATLIPPSAGWTVLYPFDINDGGQIVGGGIRNGQLGHAFLMNPLP